MISFKPGFHTIVQIVPIVPFVSKNFETIETTESIRSSLSLQRLKTRRRQRSSRVRQQNFSAIFGNEIADVNRRASLLACYLLILSILRSRRARRIQRRHRFWVRQLYKKREELGAYHTLSTLFALSASSPWSASSSLSSRLCTSVTVNGRWLMWFDNQSKLLNSAGERTASRPEPDGTDLFFSQVLPIHCSDILIFFFCFSPVQAECVSYCFPDIHSYKLILTVETKLLSNYNFKLNRGKLFKLVIWR